ncbi:amino acid adenylation domain-containing protein [Streptomyces natalensis]|uniref:Peptide synthetase n=1 Tax=Streptomyces natalensis ATCC 27448 TaxID=1240678 RepID=A0A0D7CNV6_9ACTN|nr:amino acid adenylation domain-containing protein [Streptomyces natalensis]KIZ17550.1 peptide synthetase [Streptomyces natalensis ATCC 27448]
MNTPTYDEAAIEPHRELNRTSAPYPDGSSVKELFERCAARRPEAIAVIHRGTVVSYAELNRLANCLADRLRKDGLRPGQTVGVSLDRSVELIVALLAVVKCGAAYLPFDASWPDERLNGLLESAGCAQVLTRQRSTLTERLSRHRVTPVDRDLLRGNPPDPDVRISPDDIAYINFTSGSTGRPKGVPIRHRGITRLVFGARYARLGEETTLLQLAPVSFDAATFEIWGALLPGGTCVLYPSAFMRFSELKRVVDTHGVSTVFLTTALFNTLVDEAPRTLENVETILTGGEAHSLTHIAKALDTYGPDRLVSVYGPTECTTFATFYPVRALKPGESSLPIGRPIQNTRAYLVHDGRLCRPGETGEILLAGPGLSPGYLGMPDVTRERFVEYEIDGARQRLYRTGDRAYLSEDGNLVFQGRLDDQVKINGFRIELGEIAHHLGRHPDVKQSHVTVRPHATGGKELLAFVVPTGDHCTAESIREHLRRSLPEYMVPTRIHLADGLPLSATGKVDRRALLATLETHEPTGATS